MNYYDILGVDKNSTQDEIKKAWRKKQFTTHPDQNNGDNSKNIEYSKVNEAYETLSNKNKKHMYDLGSQFNFNEIHQKKTNNELSDLINEMLY